ncbi:MAG: response regulator [Myxococcales bacterium]|nr:response regulator [Myxococcales bacterium]
MPIPTETTGSIPQPTELPSAVVSAPDRALQELHETKEALEEETKVLELLGRTGALLASTLDLQALVQAVTDAGTQLSGAEFGAFFYAVTTPAGELFKLYTLSGAPREAFAHLGNPRMTPLFAPTFHERGVIRIGDVRTDPRYGQLAPHHGMPAGHLPVASYLAVPVTSRSGEVIGGLLFGHALPDMFTERSERIIQGIAAQSAIAIDNARLYEESRRAADAERAARSEIERVSLMKDEFLATLSHELRTPLNAVLGWAELLLLKAKDDPELRRGLDTIARNARSQAQMIDDLLDMNQIASGKLRLDVQPLDLASVVEAALEAAAPSIEAKGLRLKKTLDPLAGPVSGDPQRLRQVVWNLLSNAIKFTPNGGRIDVVMQMVNSRAEITVTDSGVGITAEFLPHLFERFRQADASTTRRYGGLGLGLAIVRQLVELHGGSVRAHSEGANTGATFVIELPIRALREDQAHHSHTTVRMPIVQQTDIDLEGLTVLVVDDDADARRLVEMILREVSAEVVTAESADEGLRLMRTLRPDVIVSDIGMPDRDGYQFMRAVRARTASEGGKTPAVALTAFARSEDRTRALLAGYQVHIAKPIEPRELVVTIASLTGRAMLPDA